MICLFTMRHVSAWQIVIQIPDVDRTSGTCPFTPVLTICRLEVGIMKESFPLRISPVTRLVTYIKELGYFLLHPRVLRGGRAGHRIPVGAKFSASVQTGVGAHPASYITCAGNHSRG